MSIKRASNDLGNLRLVIGRRIERASACRIRKRMELLLDPGAAFQGDLGLLRDRITVNSNAKIQ